MKCLAIHCRRERRVGAVAIWGLVCLALTMAVAVTLGRLSVAGIRIVQQERNHAQCEWLVESGWSLANSRLKENSKYQGETWKIPADQLGGADAGEVSIEIEPRDPVATNSERQVRISAYYPADSVRHVQLTKTKTWKPQMP